MSVDDTRLWDALHELQQSLCGMCGRDRGRLIEDHDHDTGLIRGLLCRSCNTLEGAHHTGRDEHHITAECPVCIWRRTPAVAWLGWTERYEGWHNEFAESTFRDQPYSSALDRAAAARADFESRRHIIDNLYTRDGAA